VSRVVCVLVNGMTLNVLLYCANGMLFDWVDSIRPRYLGVFIVQSCKFKCSFDNALFRSVNAPVA